MSEPARRPRGFVSLRVLVVDDHPSLRELFGVYLSTEDDLALVGVAADGVQAVDQAAQLQPDAIVLDYELPYLDGLAALPALRRAVPHATIVVFSATSDPGTAATALARGANRYLVKDRDDITDVVRALRAPGVADAVPA